MIRPCIGLVYGLVHDLVNYIVGEVVLIFYQIGEYLIMNKMCLLSIALLTCFAAHSVKAEFLCGSRILMDFGPADAINGHATASPDVNGNYWNNWHPYNGNNPIPNGETFPGVIIDTNNTSTGVGFIMTNSFDSNGIRNGGLLAPDSSLLGDFAIATATEDYWFESVGGAALKLTGLNPSLTYDLTMFGTRESTSTRITRYTAIGSNGTKSVDLITSGTAIGTGGYNGNNDTTVSLTGIVPTSTGDIVLDVAIVEGGFAYLGALEVQAKPGLPSNSFPANNEHGVALNTELTWDAPIGIDSPAYNVYLGTASGDLQLVSSAQSATSFVAVLQANTDYFWRVDVEADGTLYTGLNWTFSTSPRLSAKVYLCGGQSNMQGRGLASEIPADIRGPFENIPAFWREWTDWDALQVGMGNVDKFGPTFIFGQDIANYSTNETVLILKYAVDGTDLYSRWRPPSSGGTQGDLYTDFIRVVPEALAKLEVVYSDVEIAGMIWFQGSSDSNTEVRATEYELNLTNFITDLRTEFNVPDMPFIIGDLKVDQSYATFGDVILNAQANVDMNVPFTRSFPTQDLTFTDVVHYDTNGAVACGQRFASVMELARFGECEVYPEFDINLKGLVSYSDNSTYFDLKKSDNVYEKLVEVDSGTYSYLEAKWSTYIPKTKNCTFNIEAWRTANDEGDNFVLSYSMDDIIYTDMLAISRSDDDNSMQSYQLPNGLEGIIYIRAQDTDRTNDNRALDTLNIDKMYFYTQTGCDGTIPGDVNNDCYVDILDFTAVAVSWLDCSDPQNSLCGN